MSSLTPKPEAPWIKRCSFGIKFTDEIQYTEYDENNELPEEDSVEHKRKYKESKRRAAVPSKQCSINKYSLWETIL